MGPERHARRAGTVRRRGVAARLRGPSVGSRGAGAAGAGGGQGRRARLTPPVTHPRIGASQMTISHDLQGDGAARPAAARPRTPRAPGPPEPVTPSSPDAAPRRTVAVVLAAGLGTRMKSATPKVLHPLCGRPMIQYVLDAAI